MRLVHLVNGQTCKFCLIHELDSLDKHLAYMPAKPVCDMNQKLILYKYVITNKGHFSVKGELGHQCLVTTIPHFCMIEMMCSFAGETTVKFVLVKCLDC